MKTVTFVSILFARLVNAQTWYEHHRYEYLIVHTKVYEYAQADAECADRNATVANVKTTELQNFLVGKIGNLTAPPYLFYIGARRNQTTNTFQWTDGTNVNDTQAAWRKGEPNDKGGNKDCVTMGFYWKPFDFTWMDTQCSQYSNYICQKMIAMPTTNTHSKTTRAITVVEASSPTLNTTISPEKSEMNVDQSTAAAESETSQEGYTFAVVIGSAVGGCVLGVAAVIVFELCYKRKRKKEKQKVNQREYAEIDNARIPNQVYRQYGNMESQLFLPHHM